MTVGGRLAQVHIPFDAKFSALLPMTHPFTRLYLEFVRSCITCFYFKPRLLKQVMGELTADRLQGGRPYLGSGLFFASYRIRGKTQYKTYCAVLVCLTSKAVRIELVSELLTDAFGIASEVSSLDATNFSGAATKLAEFQTRFLSITFWVDCQVRHSSLFNPFRLSRITTKRHGNVQTMTF